MPERGRKRRPVRLDLGCGTAKEPGFFGADRFALEGVDVVLDLDQPLPFRDDSVDLLAMVHSLEHVRDVIATMREVYRVCRHGAEVCIVAPYSHQGLNLANPYHLQVLNEHTPRFWTDSPTTPVPTEEYSHPHAPHWGLARSDHSDPGIDIRCLGMESFYFPEYRGLPPEEQRAARKKHLDVCDQILFRLVVVKAPITEAEIGELARRRPPFEPAYLTLRREQERAEGQEVQARSRQAERERQAAEFAAREREIQQTRDDRQALEVELARARGEREAGKEDLARAQRELADREDRLARTRTDLSRREDELARTRADLSRSEDELGRTRTDLSRSEDELGRTRTDLSRSEDELGRARDGLQALESVRQRLQADTESRQSETARLARELEARTSDVHLLEGRFRAVQATATVHAAEADAVRAALVRREAALASLRAKAAALAQELECFRSRRVVRLLDRVDRSDARGQIGTPFRQLMDDSLIFQDVHGHRLRPGPDLAATAFVAYPLPQLRAGLAALLLAPVLELPPSCGTLGVEVVSPESTIVAQAAVPLADVTGLEPFRVPVGALPDLSRGGFWLRVFARECDVPVRVFEWYRHAWGGLGGPRRLAFCGFVFAD